MGSRSRRQGGQRRRRHHGTSDRAAVRGRRSQSRGCGAEGGEAVRGRQGRLPHRHRQLRLDARGRPARRARRQADRHHGLVRGLHHRRPLLAQRLSRECPRRAAIGRARRLAVQGEAAGQGVLSRAGLRDGTFHRRRLQGERREGRRQHGRRGVRAARCQGLHPVFRAGARGAPAGALHLGRRQRHRPAAQPDAGVRPAQQPEPGRRLGHGDVAEHLGDREGGRRLRDRRRLLDRDRLAREQEIRRRLQGAPTRPSPISTAPIPTA